MLKGDIMEIPFVARICMAHCASFPPPTCPETICIHSGRLGWTQVSSMLGRPAEDEPPPNQTQPIRAQPDDLVVRGPKETGQEYT